MHAEGVHASRMIVMHAEKGPCIHDTKHRTLNEQNLSILNDSIVFQEEEEVE